LQAYCRAGLVSLVIALFYATTADAAERIRVGVAASVKENVTGVIDETPQLVTVGGDVFFNERLITTKTSSTILQFRDRSTLEVGPNATVIINRSVYNPVESVSEKTITVVAGAFRFVSGVAAAKSQTDIRTPVGTLGIRGSIVIGTVSDQGDVALMPVQGVPTWTTPSGSQSVPQGGALVAVRSSGQTTTTAQVPASFATIVRQIVTQLGVTPPPLQTFSPAQQAANANDHLVSVDAQNQLQAGGTSATAVVQPLNPAGVSTIANLMATANNALQSGGALSAQGRADAQADLSYIATVMNVQTAQHDANAAGGSTGVVQELFTVMTPAQLIAIGTSLAALSPVHAADIAIALATLLPNQVPTILSSVGSVVPTDQTQVVTAAIDNLTNQPNVYVPPASNPLLSNPPLERQVSPN
jgi:hypothetical protein